MKTKSLILAILCTFLQMNLGLNSAYSQGKGKGGKVQVTDENQLGLQDVPGDGDPNKPVTNIVPQPVITTSDPPPVVKPAPPLQNGKNIYQVPTGPGSVVPVTNPGGKNGLLPSANDGSAQPAANPNPKTNLIPSGNSGSVAPVKPDAVDASATIPAPVAPVKTPPLAPAAAGAFVPSTNPTKDPCEDKAMEDIYKILVSDHNNVLGIMFEITAMRLAKRTMEQSETYRTFEDLTVDKIKTLTDQVTKLDKDSDVQGKVRKVYETYGKKADDTTVANRYADLMKDAAEAAAKRANGACYFDKEARFRNDESSAFIMATVIGERGDLTASTKDNPAKLTDIDAATIWVVERTRAEAEARLPGGRETGYHIGEKNGNMLNISTRVTRYLGRIDDGRQSLTPAKMDELIKKEQTDFNTLVQTAYTQLRKDGKESIHDELKTCIEAEFKNKNCPNCSAQDRMTALEKNNLDIDNIQRGLLQSVSKSENLKIESGLQAKLAPIYIDFNSLVTPNTKVGVQTGESDQDLGHHFASNKDAFPGEGAIPKLPPRGTKENCKEFWVRKKAMKHGGHVAKAQQLADTATTTPPDPAQTTGPAPVAGNAKSRKPSAGTPMAAPQPQPVPQTNIQTQPLAQQSSVQTQPLAQANIQNQTVVPSQVGVQPAPPQPVGKPGAISTAPAPAPATKLVETPGSDDQGPKIKPNATGLSTALGQDIDKAKRDRIEQLEAQRQSALAARQGGDPKRSRVKQPARNVAGDTVDPMIQERITAVTSAAGMPVTYGKCQVTYSAANNTLTVSMPHQTAYVVPLNEKHTIQIAMPGLAASDICDFSTTR